MQTSLSAGCHAVRQPCRGHGRASQRSVQARATAACKLIGVGSSAPASVLSNEDLGGFIETNDEWIRTRTGIERRHVLCEGERITDHAISSARSALEMAGVAGADVDMVILCTSTPDDLFGSAAQVRDVTGTLSNCSLYADEFKLLCELIVCVRNLWQVHRFFQNPQAVSVRPKLRLLKICMHLGSGFPAFMQPRTARIAVLDWGIHVQHAPHLSLKGERHASSAQQKQLADRTATLSCICTI